MSKDNNQKPNPDNESEKDTGGKTRSTSIPKGLDTRIQKYVKAFYGSYSEFLRESARFHIIKLEKAQAQAEIWDLLGGPIIEAVTKMVDLRMSGMEDNLHKINSMIGGMEEESKMKLPNADDDDDDDDEKEWDK